MTLMMLLSVKTMELLQNRVATPIWSNFIVFNKNSVASVIAALTLTVGVNTGIIQVHRVPLTASSVTTSMRVLRANFFASESLESSVTKSTCSQRVVYFASFNLYKQD